jgi:CheY-like chemotaxis protein
MTHSASMFGSAEPSNGCVLVVEDDGRIRNTVRQTLQLAGYDVLEAEDVQHGIDTINAGENPLVVDSVIADIDMERGFDAVTYFRQQYPHVPVIVLTGLPDAVQDSSPRMKLAILGAGKGGYALLEMFSHIPEVKIIGIADKDPFAPALIRARDLGITVVEDAATLIERDDLHLLVDVTGDPKMERLIAEHKQPATEVLGGAAAKLLWTVIQYEARMQKQLLQSQKVASMMKEGVTDYLAKPIVREKLLAAVESAMDRREIHKL